MMNLISSFIIQPKVNKYQLMTLIILKARFRIVYIYQKRPIVNSVEEGEKTLHLQPKYTNPITYGEYNEKQKNNRKDIRNCKNKL